MVYFRSTLPNWQEIYDIARSLIIVHEDLVGDMVDIFFLQGLRHVR